MPDFRFKVLLVEDDSELRDLLAGFLKPAYQVIEAESVEMAMDRIAEDSPHILVTDIRMPGESGLSLLREVRARQSDLPVILITGETDRKIAIEGLKLGAFDFIEKPFEIEELLNALVRAAGLCLLKRVDEKVYAQYLELSSFIVHQDLPLLSSDKVLAIGASFGGTEAITELLLGLPANIPPCVIVQHLPIGMTAAFAEQLDRACPFLVKEAENGERLDSGKVLVAPAGMHCLVKRDDQGAYLSLSEDPKGSLHIPSVDVLFHSIAENLGSAAIGIILTGMGDDGAKGLLAMRKSGARTIAQDKGTSALFGMPAKAIELNAAEVIVPLPEIPALLIYWLRLERHSA